MQSCENKFSELHFCAFISVNDRNLPLATKPQKGERRLSLRRKLRIKAVKPTSIIFLVIALLLALGGFAATKVAAKLAADEGIELIAEADGAGSIFEHDFSEDGIGKVAVNVKDAKINVYCGAEQDKIELVNFAEGLYEFSSSNRILTVSNNSDFSQVESIASMVMSFKGIRSLQSLYNMNGLPKTVNIYISAASEIKIVELTADKSDVTIEGGTTMTDYNVSVKSGSIKIENTSTQSSVKAEIEHGNVSIENCSAANLTVNAENGDVTVKSSEAVVMNAEIKEGDLEVGYRKELSLVNLDIFTGVGEVTVDGEVKGGYYEEKGKPTSAEFTLNCGKGNITVSSNDVN